MTFYIIFYTNILAKYINQHDYESNQISSYIYNYIKKEYPATNPNFELTDTDKQNILINVKKHYPNSKLSDYEILDLININSVGIMVEQIEQLHEYKRLCKKSSISSKILLMTFSL